MSKTDEAAANLVEGENKKEKLKEVKSLVDTSEPLIRKMDGKAKSLQPDFKASILKNLGEYKSDLKKLKNQAKRIIKGKSDKGVTNDELMEAGLLGDNVEDVSENPKTGTSSTTTVAAAAVNDTVTVDHRQNGNPKAEPVINVTEKTQKADTTDSVNKNRKEDPIICVTKETQKTDTTDSVNKNRKEDPIICVTKETQKTDTTDIVNGNRKEDTVNVSGNDQKAHTVIVLNAHREADTVIVLNASQDQPDTVNVTAGNQKATAASAAADTVVVKGRQEAEDPNTSGHRKESSDKKKGIEISTEDLKKAREKIRKGKKMAADTKDIKQALLKDYHHQRGSLHQAKDIIHGVNDSVDMARRILSFIQSKMHYCKCLVITIAACFIFATLVLLYFKVVRQH